MPLRVTITVEDGASHGARVTERNLKTGNDDGRGADTIAVGDSQTFDLADEHGLTIEYGDEAPAADEADAKKTAKK